MQGIFQKENTDKVLKYGIYRHLPTYEKIIRNLVSFYLENYNGKLRMVTVGKGHDMGMSLYGANVLAKKQLSAATILSYYYPGTKILD